MPIFLTISVVNFLRISRPAAYSSWPALTRKNSARCSKLVYVRHCVAKARTASILLCGHRGSEEVRSCQGAWKQWLFSCQRGQHHGASGSSMDNSNIMDGIEATIVRTEYWNMLWECWCAMCVGSVPEASEDDWALDGIDNRTTAPCQSLIRCVRRLIAGKLYWSYSGHWGGPEETDSMPDSARRSPALFPCTLSQYERFSTGRVFRCSAQLG